jgi:hypothetical protein
MFPDFEAFHSLTPQDDAYWWQARKEVDKTTRAGLIPSRALQERRIIHERSQSVKETSGSESKSEMNLSLCLHCHSFQLLITNYFELLLSF